MATLLEDLTRQLSGTALQQMSRTLDTDPTTAGNAVSAALPMLLGALARNAAQPDGAAALTKALEKDHDGSVLDNLGAAVSGGSGSGASILNHVFGTRQGAIAAGVGQASGLETDKTAALLAMLAPVVMGALGRAQRTGGLDAGGLASMLGREREGLGGGAGGFGPLLSMLDANHDGSVVDDVMGFAAKFLGKR